MLIRLPLMSFYGENDNKFESLKVAEILHVKNDTFNKDGTVIQYAIVTTINRASNTSAVSVTTSLTEEEVFHMIGKQ